MQTRDSLGPDVRIVYLENYDWELCLGSEGAPTASDSGCYVNSRAAGDRSNASYSLTAFLVVLLANRSSILTIVEGFRAPNIALWFVLGGTVGILALILVFPFAQRLFHFAPIHAGDLLLSIGAGLACTLWFEAFKLGKRWIAAHPARRAAMASR